MKISIPAIFALAILPKLAMAVTYNILDAYSASGPAVGPWALGMADSSGGNFQLYDQYVQVPFPNGNATKWGTAPIASSFGFYRNTNNFQLNAGDIAGTIIPANDWLIHPESPAYQQRPDPVCRFTVPVSGTYIINWSTARLTQYGGSTQVFLAHKGVVLDSATTTSDGYQYHARPTQTIFALAGEKIDFRVNYLGSVSGDSTGLRATITAVPEPSAGFALTAFAAASFLRYRKRKF